MSTTRKQIAIVVYVVGMVIALLCMTMAWTVILKDYKTGTSAAPATATVASPTGVNAQPMPLECKYVLVPYVTLTDRTADEGCIRDGVRRMPMVRRCNDGRRLVRIDDIVAITGNTLRRVTDLNQDGTTAGAMNEFICAR